MYGPVLGKSHAMFVSRNLLLEKEKDKKHEDAEGGAAIKTREGMEHAVTEFFKKVNQSALIQFLETNCLSDLRTRPDLFGGKEMYATVNYPKGVLIYFTHGGVVLNPDPEKAKNFLDTKLRCKVSSKSASAVDAVYVLGKAYYFNHSCRHANLDLVTTPLIIDGESIEIISFITNRDIQVGESLTFHYYKGVPSKLRKQVIANRPRKGLTKCLCHKDCPNYIHEAAPVPEEAIVY